MQADCILTQSDVSLSPLIFGRLKMLLDMAQVPQSFLRHFEILMYLKKKRRVLKRGQVFDGPREQSEVVVFRTTAYVINTLYIHDHVCIVSMRSVSLGVDNSQKKKKKQPSFQELGLARREISS